jgi:aspartyl-tRNA synthetase
MAFTTVKTSKFSVLSAGPPPVAPKEEKKTKSSSSSLSAAVPPPAPAAPVEKVVANVATGLRSHSCNELRISDVGKSVKLCGWVQVARDMNHFAFVDLRDRYGITQIVFKNPSPGYEIAKGLGREFVISIEGEVIERISKNASRPTGDIEVQASNITILNTSKTPPFLIQDDTDANEDIRMIYRYLDIRRNPIKEGLLMRNKVTCIVRDYLNQSEFCEIETPMLIKSTPEGARDFVVPSRMNLGQFYALPQSPQTFKQILMVSGMDRYFQIVKCFRDEELRADRQPEFTQIDCEMSFVTQEDVLTTFENMMRKVFKQVANYDLPNPFPRMEYSDAMRDYGIDKPDLRFDMKLIDLTSLIQNQKGTEAFPIFKDAGLIIAISVPTLGTWGNKKIKALEKRAKTEAGASSLIWLKCEKVSIVGKEKIDSSVKSKYSTEELLAWAHAAKAQDGDLVCIFAGPAGKEADKTREICGKWRHIMGTDLGYRNEGFNALWVVNFPLLEWDEETQRYYAMHHPFTSSHPDDEELLTSDPGKARANAYDMVINGVEVGGGSIRICDQATQMKTFELLGFTPESAQEQFGFLLGAFEYGAPPHGGCAFGLDRICTILGGQTSIRNYIAFPKNNNGRDMMIDSPSPITKDQLAELAIDTVTPPTKEAKAAEEKK